MTGNRAPTSIWLLRRLGVFPNAYVRTDADDCIRITYSPTAGVGDSILLSRHDARLLAKRINECLDRTVKR